MIGLIYKLVIENYPKQYIGSTTETLLCKRMAKHRNNYKRFVAGKTTSKCSASELLNNPSCKIELIERIEYENLIELKKREQYYLDLFKYKNVNKNKAYSE